MLFRTAPASASRRVSGLCYELSLSSTRLLSLLLDPARGIARVRMLSSITCFKLRFVVVVDAAIDARVLSSFFAHIAVSYAVPRLSSPCPHSCFFVFVPWRFPTSAPFPLFACWALLVSRRPPEPLLIPPCPFVVLPPSPVFSSPLSISASVLAFFVCCWCLSVSARFYSFYPSQFLLISFSCRLLLYFTDFCTFIFFPFLS